ncbi:MAG: tail fiber domain-containing protein [Acidobacteria bacterium]|nr:tail fiber domain-containing protein [Acidobacteriota bacterium]
MSMRRLVTLVTVVVVAGLCSDTSSAQPLGTFRWQLQPYCNVVTVSVVQQGAQYQIDGTDDQCGAGQQAGVTGLAFLNPDGSIGFGLNIVTAPGGMPVHVDATIALATLGGTWRDSAGATGSFVFTPGTSSGGSPRPPGGIGLSAIDPTQIQSRVTGVCPAGELMTGVNQDGTVTCEAVATGGGGDITGVAAGVGLLGGGTAGDVALAVNFAGTGAALSAARSDHTHAGPETNSTRIGALALSGVTTGTHNTAIGSGALEQTTTGGSNTAVGAGALYANVTGASNVALGALALNANTANENTAVGRWALYSNVSGATNTAVGSGALTSNVAGSFNTAVGQNALFYSLGSNNVAIGRYAGDTLVDGNNNIYIGADGLATESNATYIGNIHDALSQGGQPVYVNANGKLGTFNITTSARVTEYVAPLGDVSDVIRSLRPVSFHYKPEFDDGSGARQYGLIGEDAAALMPGLVVRDAAGEAQSVRQDILPTLLVAEIQRLQGQLADQATAIAELRTLLEELRARR